VATVPVAYLLGRELLHRRAGIAAAALVAVNPMLLWYSQEGRAYSLFALLCAVSALYFVRALRGGARRDFVAWGVFSGLALATHYFAFFPVAVEAGWLALRGGRRSAPGVAIVGATGLALLPLLVHQTSIGHAEWIGGHALGHRLWETGVSFMVGETGDVIGRSAQLLPALAPLLLAAAALLLVALRGDRRERRAATLPLLLAAATVLAPLLLALAVPGKDYVLARNLMPALVPLLSAVAVGTTVRAARRAGLLVGCALFAYSLVFGIVASLSPSLQRPDWDSVAARLGPPTAPRALVSWTLGEAPLRYYLGSGSFQAFPRERLPWYVHEIDFISDGPSPPPPRAALGPGFHQLAYAKVGRLYLRRYALPGPDLAELRLAKVREPDLGFGSNGVLVDGVGPG
jgi:4-amino-4-deoxy-L-arabinose transferase-like glycosyltransferase